MIRALRARLAMLSLRTRLVLLGAAMTAAVVAVAFLVLRQRAIGEVRRVFAAELAGSVGALRGAQQRNLNLLLATSSLVSTSPTLRAALETARIEVNAGGETRPELLATVHREVQRIFGELDRDLLVVTDDRGRVLAATGSGAPAVPQDLSQVPAVRHALESSAPVAESSFAVLRLADGAYLVGGAAILVQGFPAGVLLLGEHLERLMPALGAAAGADLVVTVGTEVLAAHPDGLSDSLRAAVAAALPDTTPRWARLAGHEYVVAAFPLGATPDGRIARLHALSSLAGALQPLERTLGRAFLLSGLLAVALAAIGGAASARATLQPLQRFVSFMGAGAEHGSYDHFTPGEAAPVEIRALTDSYNTLIGSLARQHAQLEERSAELSSANDSLIEEIAHREKAESALRTSEEALRQSQRLEALGTLAGGVAHDFNNLISVITGYAALLQTELPEGSSLRADVTQIDEAAQRATGLVRQLLAFSRKQVLQPRVLELNAVVEGMAKLLGRLIGEDVALELRLEPGLSRIMADPGQIEQVLMNLAVNARDAMPQGGRLHIETAEVELGAAYEVRPEALPAGPAVMLVVRDTGVGMDEATRARIFEPFFTTKAAGKGTGLGLATVYGIVKQSGGNIAVYSQPGHGTSFRIYFPPVAATEEGAGAGGTAEQLPRGTETVLVAEDDEQVRGLVERTLGALGYRVIAAGDGEAAVAASHRHEGAIDLLVTDVVMPAMGGVELAAMLRRRRPDLKVVFVSGYADEAIERHGVLAPDSVFLEKPIPAGRLARAVRAVLDNGAPPA